MSPEILVKIVAEIPPTKFGVLIFACAFIVAILRVAKVRASDIGLLVFAITVIALLGLSVLVFD